MTGAERGRGVALSEMMRRLLPLSCLMLVACGKGEPAKEQAQPAPTPRATAPAPRTPVMQITPAPGATPAWLKPQPGQGAELKAPYGDLLNKPVVEGAPK